MAYQWGKGFPKNWGPQSVKRCQSDQVHIEKENKKSGIFHPLCEGIHDWTRGGIPKKENKKRKSS